MEVLCLIFAYDTCKNYQIKLKRVGGHDLMCPNLALILM